MTISYFLIDLWMTISKNDLMSLRRGWDGIEKLNESQEKDFNLHINDCNVLNVSN
jgi:hypothetical protein